MASHPKAILEGFDEYWTLNTGTYYFRHDLTFVMDHLSGEAHKFPHYAEFLKKHDKPIITSDDYEQTIPHAIPYPIKEIKEHVGQANWYFHNSVPYILAYAHYIGVKGMAVFGADYDYPDLRRREENRANAEYWVGWCRAKGMRVQIVSESTLCNTRGGMWFYGYRNPPFTKDEVA
jgi:hypothetical protein